VHKKEDSRRKKKRKNNEEEGKEESCKIKTSERAPLVMHVTSS